MADAHKKTRHRLFVALSVPQAHASKLSACRDEHISARWTSPQQYHLTLQFIGYVDTDHRSAIAEALRHIHAKRFTLEVSGIGAFPSPRQPRVIVAFVCPNDRLAHLQQAVVHALSGVGIEPEARPFKAHLTLARLKDTGARQIQSYLHEHEDFHLKPFRVSTFHLYESTLHPTGAVYQQIETYPLV